MKSTSNTMNTVSLSLKNTYLIYNDCMTCPNFEACRTDTELESLLGQEDFALLGLIVRLHQVRRFFETQLSLYLSRKDLDRFPIEQLESMFEKLSQDFDLKPRFRYDWPKQRMHFALLSHSIDATKLHIYRPGIDREDIMACYDDLLAEADQAGYKLIRHQVNWIVDSLQAIFAHKLDSGDVQADSEMDVLTNEVAKM